MLRRLFTFLSFVSLALALLMVVIWVLSYVRPQQSLWVVDVSPVDMRFPADPAGAAVNRTYDVATQWQAAWNRGHVWVYKIKEWQGRRGDGSEPASAAPVAGEHELRDLETDWYPREATPLGRLGFVFRFHAFPSGPSRPEYNSHVALRGAAVPCWFLVGVLLFTPTVMTFKRRRRRAAASGG